jgi:hypothetical protein
MKHTFLKMGWSPFMVSLNLITNLKTKGGYHGKQN